MAHLHDVIDTDKHFIINPATRAITTESSNLTLIQYDHNSQRYTFEIPRFIEEHDMSLCNEVQVHYNNVSKNKKEINSDFYTVTDMQISPEDDAIVTFSWLISESATQIVGKLNFSITFGCISDDGLSDYIWHTKTFDKIVVSEGIVNTGYVVVEHSDFVQRMELLAEQNKSVIDGFAKNYEQNVHYEETVKDITDILTPLNDTLQYMTYRTEDLIAKTDSNFNSVTFDDESNAICFMLSGYRDEIFYDYRDYKITMSIPISAFVTYMYGTVQRVTIFPVSFGSDRDTNGARYATGVMQFNELIQKAYFFDGMDETEKENWLNKLLSPIVVKFKTDGSVFGISFLDSSIYEFIRGNTYDPPVISVYEINYHTPIELSEALDVINGEVV